MTAKDSGTALDHALKELVTMPGGPPGVIAVVQRGKQRKVHTFGIADRKNEQPMEVAVEDLDHTRTKARHPPDQRNL